MVSTVTAVLLCNRAVAPALKDKLIVSDGNSREALVEIESIEVGAGGSACESGCGYT